MTLNEDNLGWKTPRMENDLGWKITLNKRQPWMESNLWMEDDLGWKTTLDQI